MSAEHSSYRQQATADAARWFVTMQSRRVSQTEREGFAQWLSQSALHVQEYLAVAAAWRMSGEVTQGAFSAPELISAARADLAKVSNVLSLPARAAPRVQKRWFAVAASIAAVLLISAPLLLGRPRKLEYQTQAGDQLTASLADGSTVRLNTKTRVRVHLSSNYRDVELLEGEALFTVAKDPHRPFRVRSNHSEIRAVGTAFNVYRQRALTTVTVLEGQVEVAPITAAPASFMIDRARALVMPAKQNKPPRASFRLLPHQQASVGEDGKLIGTQEVDVRRVTAWSHPLLRFSDEPLSSVIEQFNRYNDARLVLDDPLLAAVRVSGIFSSSDADSLIQYLERTEHVVVVERDAATRVIQRPSRSAAQP